MRRLIVALLLVIPFGPAWAGPVTNFTLDNGMEVVVIEDHRAPAVTQMVWYRAGSADEPPGMSGVAHFLEHLLFKGTETLEPGEFSATVARHGGTDNAFTSYDYTAYFQRIAADRLGLVMEMEADRMANLRLSDDDITTERDVILEERNQRVENSPAALFRERMGATQYLNHPYGAPIIGWRHEMEALDRVAAVEFYSTYYAPNNAILIVAGDADPEEVRALAEKHYGRIPANPDLPERIRPQEPPQLAERRLSLRDPRVSQPYVARSYLAPERDSGAQREAAALTLLAALLGNGQTSVLNEALQFERSIAVQVGAWYSGMSLDDASLDFVVVPAPGVTLDEAEAALGEVLTGFLETGPDPEHLERIKSQLRAQEIYERDDVTALAQRYGRALTQGLTVADVQAWPDILQEITDEEIMDAARNVLDRERSVTGYLMAPEVTQ
ncbi:peptidase M16 [Roseovarius sp. A46]|uniref:M16 family metallopeptidase n=1 Tax=Roseovarius sp. A46 TaxID=2109331 RepID=UPI0010115510|nr:pitrilysin family protein [Roseovarius sp. A46]RXV62653.1 peptidase M16 [Roseovarius sp. A46]